MRGVWILSVSFFLPGPVVNTHQNRGWLVEIEGEGGRMRQITRIFTLPYVQTGRSPVVVISYGKGYDRYWWYACGCLLNDWCRAIRRITISIAFCSGVCGATFSGLVETGLSAHCSVPADPARSTYPGLTYIQLINQVVITRIRQLLLGVDSVVVASNTSTMVRVPTE